MESCMIVASKMSDVTFGPKPQLCVSCPKIVTLHHPTKKDKVQNIQKNVARFNTRYMARLS